MAGTETLSAAAATTPITSPATAGISPALCRGKRAKRASRHSYVTRDVHEARAFLCEAEFRQISDPVYRGALATILGICSVDVAAQAVNVSHKRVRLAVDAIRSGRDVGVAHRPPLLQPEQEERLCKWVLFCVEEEKPPTAQQVADEATAIAREGKQNPIDIEPVSRTYVAKFIERHKDRLQFKAPRGLEPERLITAEDINRWFAEYHALLETKKYAPALIFNWDETMGSLARNKLLKAVCRRNSDTVIEQVLAQNEHLTIGCFIAADGTRVGKPVAIYTLKELPVFADETLYDKFAFESGPSGWITSAIMLRVIRNVFIPGVARRRGAKTEEPALLLWDGHTAHETAEIVKVLAECNIGSKLFVPHASHILQPLDLTIFRSFKASLRQIFVPSPFSLSLHTIFSNRK